MNGPTHSHYARPEPRLTRRWTFAGGGWRRTSTVALIDLGPHLAQLSCVVLVVDGWDASREELVRGVERFGVRVVRVGVGVDVPLGTKVPVATLQAGEPVAL